MGYDDYAVPTIDEFLYKGSVANLSKAASGEE